MLIIFIKKGNPVRIFSNIRGDYNENEAQNQNVIKGYEKEGKYIAEEEDIAHAQANYSDEQQRQYENEEEK